MRFTYHAEYERAERIARLEEVLGFTAIALEVRVPEERKRYCLTTSGILIVKALNEDLVITAWMVNIEQCYYLYRLAGKGQIAPKMYKRVLKNLERHNDLIYI